MMALSCGRARPDADGHGRARLTLVHLRARLVSGGALVPFDVKLPPRAIPLAAWPAGSGAWYLAATEEPQKDHVLVSVWWVDATGRASRIGCDPVDGPTRLARAARTTGAATSFRRRTSRRPGYVRNQLPREPVDDCERLRSPTSRRSPPAVRPRRVLFRRLGRRVGFGHRRRAPPTQQRVPTGSDSNAGVRFQRRRLQGRDAIANVHRELPLAAWSDCGGAGYVPGSAEICGDGVDNDCNGGTDEGCACKPVAPGSARSFPSRAASSAGGPPVRVPHARSQRGDVLRDCRVRHGHEERR